MSTATLAWKQGSYRGYGYSSARRNPRNELWPETTAAHSVALSTRRAELSARAAGILGENGVARFHEFWSYTDGWDFGQGKALSQSSVTRLEKFFEKYSRFRGRPSLFLTPGGCLMLGWEDEAGNTIEIEFTSRGFSLYLASTDEEQDFSDGELPLLLEMLSQVNANGAP